MTGMKEEQRKEMREILFKAKRKDNGKWIEGYYAVIGAKDAIIKAQAEDYYSVDENVKKSHGNEVIEVDPSTVCQYTGLTDKNGRKIFEGDIVGFLDCTSTESGYWEQGCAGQVLWSKEGAMFCVTNRLMAESYEVLQDCEVIGNIFGNPELLEPEA